MLPTSTPAQTGGRVRGRQRGSTSPKATHPLAPTSAGSRLSPRAPLQGRGLSPAHPAEIREGKERAGQEELPQDGQGLSRGRCCREAGGGQATSGNSSISLRRFSICSRPP